MAVDFDITIKAETLLAESVKSGPFTPPALNLSFDGKWFPVGITLNKATTAQAKQIADAINAIMDGRAVTIAPEE